MKISFFSTMLWKKAASREQWGSIMDTATLKKSMPWRDSTTLNDWLKNLRNGQCLCAWGVKILIFMNAL